MNRNSNGMSTGTVLICTIGIVLFIAWINAFGTSKCNRSGCDNDAKKGSSYCYLHDNSTYKYNSSNTSSSSHETYSSGSSFSKINQSSMDSYDDGYNAIYEDDDYDWDRYWSDDDYATGVDDAMKDEDW